jgi:protein SCO1
MKKWCTTSNFCSLLAFISLISCTNKQEKTSRVEELPFYNDASFTPHWLSPSEVPNDFHRIPPFALLNQFGEQVTEKNLNEKVTVVDFFFTTCPGICPKMTSNMLIVQEAFMSNNDLQILSHSVTPEFDSVEVLRNYADVKGIEKEKWHLLTGERSVIYDLGRSQYFIEEDLGLEKDPEDFIHTENFVLIDQNRRVRGIYNGLNKSSVQQLIADAKMLLKS